YYRCFCCSLTLCPSLPSLFPYTTLFRSVLAGPEVERAVGVRRHVDLEPQLDGGGADQVEARVGGDRDVVVHTVELHRVAHHGRVDRKSTRLNSSHQISYAVFCLKKKNNK